MGGGVGWEEKGEERGEARPNPLVLTSGEIVLSTLSSVRYDKKLVSNEPEDQTRRGVK